MKRFLFAMMLAHVCAGAGLAAEPTVSNVTAKQRYPWNGLVDITCKVTGINGVTNGLYFVMSAVDSGKTNRLSHFGIVQSGVNSDREVHTNGNYKLLWDAQKDLAEGVYSNMVVQVDLKAYGRGIQLWEGGPYWATTNIGAENPEDSGYYFWWGDTVGYKRTNDISAVFGPVNHRWDSSDGAVTNFSFSSDNVPTCGKSISELVSQGWMDSNNSLVAPHDAAHVNWGGSWRLPTKAEFDALVSNCTWTWTTRNGVNGFVVTGKNNYASASVFLPVTGLGRGTTLSNTGEYNAGGPYGYYWSSDLTPNGNYDGYFASGDLAWSLFFESGDRYTMYYDRFDGRPIRPVQGFTE